MLKALELVGFKSFADKTRFEFPRGITSVVGPNGSGKSNIVDAIKWVLGEQSVKSLRGKEMADVIFNGSGARRGQNSAEVTLTFDNATNLLAIDTPEVHITRRVYRSGEGEYLINRQACRLRDIRDLLAGTGLGTQAYSVIEQGKVDVLLQSSPRERRIIFEEAAGISRFKAKKLEALRRLERVDQNLLRLSDIVDEVDNRLRSVRSQAGKARRYRDYTGRLQELRTQVGLVDWTRLSEKLAEFEAELAEMTGQRDGAVAEAESIEARLLEAETHISDLNEAIRETEARIAANRERIAGRESTIEHQRARGRDLETEIARHRQQLAAMSVRAGDLQQQLRETGDAVQTAADNHRRIARAVAEGERALTELMGRLDRLRGENEDRRTAYLDAMRSAASLGNEISALESRVAAAEAAGRRSRQRLDELDGQIHELAAELETLGTVRDELAAKADDFSKRLADARRRRDQRAKQLAARQSELANLKQRRSGMAERASVLEELERRHEGLSPGVRDVLNLSRTAATGPFRQVRGLVADLLHVSVEAAALVEAALGDKAQHVVVTGEPELVEYLKSDASRLAGRVGFIRMDGPDERRGPAVDLEGRPGVVGRADRFVQCDPQYTPLARKLLGQTWIVENLAHALALAESDGRHVRLVTLAGEVLEADGTLIVGPRVAAAGLISRRSELRALRGQLEELDAKIRDTESAIQRVAEQIECDDRDVAALEAEHREAAQALAEHGHKIAAAEERASQLDRQRAAIAAELETSEAEHAAAVESLAEARAKQEELQSGLAEMEAVLARIGRDIDALEADRQVRLRETTDTRVEMAKSEERLENLRARMTQFEESQQERQRAIGQGREQLAQCLRRAEESTWNVLRAESEVAELYLRKEALARETVGIIDRREAVRAERAELGAEAQKLRNRARKIEEKIHARELAAGDVRHERNSLADRLREDYGIELAELQHEPTDEEKHQREEVQAEIDELRRKINNLGNVNLEALHELEELEARHANLAGQFQDLSDAKASLEKIIDKINVDSRRLFVETLETVRGHFKTLFRDLFGGGQADIVLDEGEDILETGIEIVARPPGKEPRSISLLSGGEKTLTCVAMLLAIFRSRPSPFCVLDEVDAALDEANIDRFTKVLEDFLAWTQFIIVTHSKKTMTCADTIYGVTMQESGVSKQVSVRFEDVSEDGHIRISDDTADAPPATDEDEHQAA